MLLYFKKLSPNVCRKTSEDHFLKGHTKKRSAKVAQNFLGKFGKIWAKILCTPKNLIAPTPMPQIFNWFTDIFRVKNAKTL